jgi:hypothetical protein
MSPGSKNLYPPEQLPENKAEWLAREPDEYESTLRAYLYRLLQLVVPLGSRVSLTYRLVAPVSKTTSAPAAQLMFYHIFIRGGDHPVMMAVGEVIFWEASQSA